MITGLPKKNFSDFQYKFVKLLLVFTPTESNARGASHLTNKPHSDLRLNKGNQLESTFIKIINSGKSNIIVGGIYKHRNMGFSDFNKSYIS